MMEEPVISAKRLSKRYYLDTIKKSNARLRILDLLRLPYDILQGDLPQFRNRGNRVIWALKDVSFDLQRGERLGVIGRNGAGKTTLLKILSRLIYPTEGEAVIRGRTTALFGVGTGFKPKLTGRENILYSAALHGMTKREIRDRMDEIIEFSGIERFIDMPIHHYSKGMYARLAFSVAAHLDSEILLLDEVLAGGDIGFQKKCLARMEGLAGAGRTILFVSHNMNAVIGLCNRCIWIEEGQIVEEGPPRNVVQAYAKRMLKLQASFVVSASNPHESVQEPAPQPVTRSPAPHDDAPVDRAPCGAELIRIELLDQYGQTKELFIRDEPIRVRVEYRVLRDDIPILPVLHLHREGVHVLTTHPLEVKPEPKGSVFQSQVEIPSRLLNTGEYDFSIALVTPVRPKWRHVFLENVLSIKVVPENDPERIFSGDYRGCVRPDLDWVSKRLRN